jgi:hypothetical protein
VCVRPAAQFYFGGLSQGLFARASRVRAGQRKTAASPQKVSPVTFGFTVDEFKGVFFDRAKVEKAVDGTERQQLSKGGAFIMRDARQSIRSSKKSAAPGQPPRSHKGDFKRNIFFGYDSGTRSVVIGAARFARSGGNLVPQLMEDGGNGVVRRRRGRPAKAKFAPHPYMGPALDKNREKLPSLFVDSVKG